MNNESIRMYSSIKISEFLHRKKELVRIDPDTEYSLVTVKLHHNGVVLREKKKGSLLGSNMYKVSKGQFILSGIDARNGAFGIIPDELDEAIVTNDFWCFDVDESKVMRDFFYWLTNTPLFLDACIKSSKGETQRIRLQKDLFYNFEFQFPPVDKQRIFLQKFNNIDSDLFLLNDELNKQFLYVSLLRQAILQEAVEGKLTTEWRKANPDLVSGKNHAEQLLKKIKVEKEQLVNEGKIKKQKPLPPIADTEKPFCLPEGWMWCRLGDVTSKIGSGSTPKGSNYSPSGIPFFRSQNIHDSGLDYDDIKYITEKIHNKMNGTIVQPNDLLLNITGGSLGRCALVPCDFSEGNVSQHVCIIRNIVNDQKYLHFLILSPLFQRYIFDSTTGAGREGLPKYNLEKFIIPLPPLEEQKTIVEVVKRLMAKLDELKKQVEERREQTAQLMFAVLREAFV